MAAFTFDVAGDAGGWSEAWFGGLDTISEVRDAINRALVQAGFQVVAAEWSWDDLAIADRVLRNAFQYRAQVTVRNDFMTSVAQAREAVRRVFADVTNHEPAISGPGDPGQADPGFQVEDLPAVADAAAGTIGRALVPVLLVAIAVAVIVVKVK